MIVEFCFWRAPYLYNQSRPCLVWYSLKTSPGLIGHDNLMFFFFWSRLCWKKTRISLLPSPNQVRNMHNYLRPFLNPIHSRKITVESANGNHTSNLDVLKSNRHGENEDQNHRNLVNPKSSTQWLEPWSRHTFGGKKKKVKAMALYLSRWWKTKVMET